MKYLRVALSFAFLMLFSLKSFSQEKKNAVTLEVLGKSIFFFDINYGRYLTEKFQVGAGLGMAGVSKITFIDETVTRFDFRIPIYGSYAFSTKRHHLVSELGIIMGGYTDSITGVNIDGVVPFISLGYEVKGENYVFRVPVYLFYAGENELIGRVVPWVGVSLGRLF